MDMKLVEYEKAFELFGKNGKCLVHVWKMEGNSDILNWIMDHYQISAEPYQEVDNG